MSNLYRRLIRHYVPIAFVGTGFIASAVTDTRTANLSPSNITSSSRGAFVPVAVAATKPVATPAILARTPGRQLPDFGKLPIRFEPNVGQASARVRYFARGGGYDIGVTEHEIILGLASGSRVKPHLQNQSSPASTKRALLHFSVVDAKPQPQLRAEQEQQSTSNYFIGADSSKWHRNVHNFGAVRYEQVYPGIDWVVYGNPQQFEYDLVVAPNADPRKIKLKIDGADHLSLAENGDLLVMFRDQTLRQLKPVIYQRGVSGERRNIDGRYVLDRQQVTFALDQYDHSRQLIIDPAFVYSTYLGGSNLAAISGIAVDQAGNAYVVGTTASTNFPTVDPLQSANNEAATAEVTGFVAKFNASGSALLYSTYLGGTAPSFGPGDTLTAIAVDSSGNAYVTGTTPATDFPTLNAYQATSTPNSAVVAKLNGTGSALVYSTYLGNTDRGNAIAVDSAGEAYVVGETGSVTFPTTVGAFDTASTRAKGFVTKFNASGDGLIYSTHLGGSGGSDGALAVAVDSAGEAFVAGDTNSADFPTVGPIQAKHTSNGFNAFVTKFNAAGSALEYSTYLGGSGEDTANGIAIDSEGNAYVVGTTSSLDFPLANALQSVNKSGSISGTTFVAKFNATGSALVYSTYLGGSGGDWAAAVALDSSGDAYIAGYTDSTDFPTVMPLQAVNNAASVSGSNAFITQLNAAGNEILFSTYLGGSGSPAIPSLGLNGTQHGYGDAAGDIAVDAAGNVYVAGAAASTNFPLVNPNDSTPNGGFVTKIEMASSSSSPTGGGGGSGGGGAMGWGLIGGLGIALTDRLRRRARMRRETQGAGSTTIG
jgi:hypothetical protein